MKFSFAVLAAALTLAPTTASVLADGNLNGMGAVELLNSIEYDVDFTPEEQQFITQALVKSFHKTHDQTDVLDLSSASLESQIHAPAAESETGVIGLSSFKYGMLNFFPMWTCKNGQCPAAISTFVESSGKLEQHGGSCGPKCRPDDDSFVVAPTSAHEGWESKFCTMLKKSNSPVLQHVETCKISFEEDISAVMNDAAQDDEETHDQVDDASLKRHGGSCGPKCRPDDDSVTTHEN